MPQFTYFHDSFKAELIKSTGKLNLIKNKLLDLEFVKNINDRKNKMEGSRICKFQIRIKYRIPKLFL